jgi:VIT1/CCC1 family predicted Fe2+/Mn2+ transporter
MRVSLFLVGISLELFSIGLSLLSRNPFINYVSGTLMGIGVTISIVALLRKPKRLTPIVIRL